MRFIEIEPIAEKVVLKIRKGIPLSLCVAEEVSINELNDAEKYFLEGYIDSILEALHEEMELS